MFRPQQNTTGQPDDDVREVTHESGNQKKQADRRSGQGHVVRGIDQWIAREIRDYLARRPKY